MLRPRTHVFLFVVCLWLEDNVSERERTWKRELEEGVERVKSVLEC